MSKLPEQIHASRHLYYSVESIVETILDMDSERTRESITLDEVLEIALEYVYEDFATMIDFEPILEDDEGNLLN